MKQPPEHDQLGLRADRPANGNTGWGLGPRRPRRSFPDHHPLGHRSRLRRRRRPGRPRPPYPHAAPTPLQVRTVVRSRRTHPLRLSAPDPAAAGHVRHGDAYTGCKDPTGLVPQVPSRCPPASGRPWRCGGAAPPASGGEAAGHLGGQARIGDQDEPQVPAVCVRVGLSHTSLSCRRVMGLGDVAPRPFPRLPPQGGIRLSTRSATRRACWPGRP